jgi:hypothetical protein
MITCSLLSITLFNIFAACLISKSSTLVTFKFKVLMWSSCLTHFDIRSKILKSVLSANKVTVTFCYFKYPWAEITTSAGRIDELQLMCVLRSIKNISNIIHRHGQGGCTIAQINRIVS